MSDLVFCKAISSYHISSPQLVSDTAFISNSLISSHLISSHLILWPTGSEWYCPSLLTGHLIPSYPMTHSKWVTLPFFLPGSHISSHDKSGCVCHFFLPGHYPHLIPYSESVIQHLSLSDNLIPYSQRVSNTAFSLLGSLILYPMMDRLWVVLPFDSARKYAHISSNNHQEVSDTTPCSFLNSHCNSSHVK